MAQAKRSSLKCAAPSARRRLQSRASPAAAKRRAYVESGLVRRVGGGRSVMRAREAAASARSSSSGDRTRRSRPRAPRGGGARTTHDRRRNVGVATPNIVQLIDRWRERGRERGVKRAGKGTVAVDARPLVDVEIGGDRHHPRGFVDPRGHQPRERASATVADEDDLRVRMQGQKRRRAATMLVTTAAEYRSCVHTSALQRESSRGSK